MDLKNFNIQELMSNFQNNAGKLQENFRKAYDELIEKVKDRTVFGKAGGDLVIVEMNLRVQMIDLKLKPALFEEKPEVIAGLIVAATNQAITLAQETMRQEMTMMTKKMGVPSDWSSMLFTDKKG